MINQQIERLLPLVNKPGRYVGGEMNSVIKEKREGLLRFAFCFPDTYEVGLSHLGMKILYSLFNEREDIWCERVFAPWIDMEARMREKNIPLYGLESGDPLTDFDFIGFTLQYELSYTNVLGMLDLGHIQHTQHIGDAGSGPYPPAQPGPRRKGPHCGGGRALCL